jgi:hypothetical protein
MANPTIVTITFTGGSGSPVTLNISSASDFRSFVRNGFIAGGFWFMNAGTESFIPWGQITNLTAQ